MDGDKDKIGPWPNGYAIWREAMEYRVAGYRYTPAVTVSQINEARGWLFDRNQPKTARNPSADCWRWTDGWASWKRSPGRFPKENIWRAKTCGSAGDPAVTATASLVWDTMTRSDIDVNGDGKITNDIDRNGDGKVTLADWERGAFIVVNSWGENWSKDGKIYLLYSAMVDPTWERGNFLGRIEVSRHLPQRTLKLKLACNKRSDLRVTIGIAGDKNATKPEHELAPQALNGWPLFGNGRQRRRGPARRTR